MLSVEEPEQRAQHDADDDAGDQGKIESGIAALEHDISRQPPQPNPGQNRPHDADDQND